MHDLRFYQRIRDITLGEIASLVGGQVQGSPDVSVVTVGAAENAEAGAVCFYDGKPAGASSVSSRATACLVKENAANQLPASVIGIIVRDPKKAFAQASRSFLKPRGIEEPQEDLGPAQISPTVRVASSASISDGVEIGDNTFIAPGVVIGPGVHIGRNCHIGPNVVIEAALIGNDVLIKANSVIGGTGFGLIYSADGVEYSPHYGRVIIQDRAGIGSCTCIDRGAFADTVIGEGSHIDNLVQIGHNVAIGRQSAIAAFGGLSGTVKVGDGVLMGGRVGIGDHVNIGDGSRLAADSAIMRDVPPGETWGGTPAKPFRQWMREVAWLAKQAQGRSTKD